MKTTNAIIAGVLIVISLMSTTKLFASDKDLNAQAKTENAINRQDNTQKVSADDSIIADSTMNQSDYRQYLEDLVALPWLIKEVVIRPAKKSENTAEKKQCGIKQTAYK